MGTVHLTFSHHRLHIHERPEVNLGERVVLDRELLVRPILNRGQLYKSPNQHVIRAALQALEGLPGFNAAVSFSVVEKGEGRHIAIPHRVWGEITLDSPENVVLGFSHDTRFSNRPFSSLLQWLEEDYPDGELNDEEFERFCLGWSSPGRWFDFFKGRIRRKIDSLRTKAEGLRSEATSLITRSDIVEAALKVS